MCVQCAGPPMSSQRSCELGEPLVEKIGGGAASIREHGIGQSVSAATHVLTPETCDGLLSDCLFHFAGPLANADYQSSNITRKLA